MTRYRFGLVFETERNDPIKELWDMWFAGIVPIFRVYFNIFTLLLNCDNILLVSSIGRCLGILKNRRGIVRTWNTLLHQC